MAEKNNAKCSICGDEYYVCLSCKEALSLNPWKRHTCTASHYQIFQIVRGFNTNVYTKDEAKTKLKNVNLDDIESLKPNIKKIIKDILKDDYSVTKAIEEVEPVEVEIVNAEENTEDNVVVEDIEKVENTSKPNVFRKKHYK